MAIESSQNGVMNRYLAKVKFKYNSLPTTNDNGQGVINFVNFKEPLRQGNLFETKS